MLKNMLLENLSRHTATNATINKLKVETTSFPHV